MSYDAPTPKSRRRSNGDKQVKICSHASFQRLRGQTVDDNSKGSDSTHESIDAVEAAKSLAESSGSIIAISGAVDIITDGHRVVGAKDWVSMLRKMTGTSCSVTALIAAFVAIDPSRPLEATASALSVFGLASEIGMDLA